jgi:PAS domain-containing protein
MIFRREVVAMADEHVERKVAQEQLAAVQEVLRVSEQRYRAAFETSLDAIAICRMDDGMFVDVNRQFFTILGYEREELVGQSSEELSTWTDSDGQDHRGGFVDVAGRSSRELDIWENPHDWELLTGILRHESGSQAAQEGRNADLGADFGLDD